MARCHRLHPLFVVSAGLAAVTTAFAQAPTAKLTVTGDVKTPLALSAADIAGMPRTKVSVPEQGQTVTYEGVRVAGVLKKAGVPLGGELRRNSLATYVLAVGSDGYSIVFLSASWSLR